MRFLILSLLISTSLTYSAGPERRVANYDNELVNEGKKTLASFLACGNIPMKHEIDKTKFKECSDEVLSSSMNEIKKAKTAAWLFMGFKIRNISLCDKKGDEYFSFRQSYELQLCFDVLYDDEYRRGTAFFKKEAQKLKISHFQY